jgi:hypothetical protein
MEVFSVLRSLISWTQVSLSTTASQIFNGAASRTASAHQQSVIFTNNDPSNTIYIGPGSSVASTNFMKSLAPGEMWIVNLESGFANNLYAVAGSGTPNLSLVIGQ